MLYILYNILRLGERRSDLEKIPGRRRSLLEPHAVKHHVVELLLRPFLSTRRVQRFA